MQPRRHDPTTATPAFGEQVAQWRLQLRTEVKKASALPTAMFDVCDPMVETRLVETVESMLACLQEPAPEVVEQAAGEQRIERVVAAELQQLPQHLRHADASAPSLDDGLQDEYFAVLIDTAAAAEPGARATAGRLLARDFAPRADAASDDAADELWRCTQAAVAGEAGAEAQLAELCKRIAAGALQRPSEAGPHGAST